MQIINCYYRHSQSKVSDLRYQSALVEPDNATPNGFQTEEDNWLDANVSIKQHETDGRVQHRFSHAPFSESVPAFFEISP